jgi:hypothetical protein
MKISISVPEGVVKFTFRAIRRRSRLPATVRARYIQPAMGGERGLRQIRALRANRRSWGPSGPSPALPVPPTGRRPPQGRRAHAGSTGTDTPGPVQWHSSPQISVLTQRKPPILLAFDSRSGSRNLDRTAGKAQVKRTLIRYRPVPVTQAQRAAFRNAQLPGIAPATRLEPPSLAVSEGAQDTHGPLSAE